MPLNLKATVRQLRPLADPAHPRRGRIGPVRLAVALAAVLVVSAGIGVASGAIPSGDGTISACHAKLAGVRYLRLIDTQAGETCKGSETKLTWNQKGAKGDPGPQGPEGDPGPQGPKGDPGLGTLNLRQALGTAEPGQTQQVDSFCEPGERVTGGGFILPDGGQDVRILSSGADLELKRWIVEIANDGGQEQDVLTEAVCAS
jgi:hypothetical protein